MIALVSSVSEKPKMITMVHYEAHHVGGMTLDGIARVQNLKAYIVPYRFIGESEQTVPFYGHHDIVYI